MHNSNLPSHVCGMLWVHVKSSTVNHDMAGTGCFSMHHFRPESTIGHYCETLAFTNFEFQSVQGARFVEGVIPVTEE